MNNYEKAVFTLNKLKDNHHFASFIKEREKKSDGSIDPIENYLITPVQRIPRYSLLLQDLLTHTWKLHPDYENISRAYKRMNEVASEVNEKKRSRENQAKIIQIYNSLSISKKYDWSKKLLVDQKTRKFVKEGWVIEAMLKGKPTRYFAILLSDMLLWTVMKKNQYEFKGVNDLTGAKADLKTNNDNSFVIHLRTSNGMRVLRGEDDEDTAVWCRSFKEVINPTTTEHSLEQSSEQSIDEEARKRKSMTTMPIVHHVPSDKALMPRTMRTNLKLADLRYIEDLEKKREERIQQERKNIEAWQQIDTMEDLAKFSDEGVDKHLKLYEDEVYASYSRMQSQLKALDLTLDTTEIAFIGRAGEGKTSLISSILGYPLPRVKLNRPLHIHMVNNLEHETPIIWVRKDFSLKITKDVVVSTLDQLEKELTKRAKKTPSDSAVHIYFEKKDVLNITLIDTLDLSDYTWISDKKPNRLTNERVSHNIACDVKKNLVFVEECKSKESMCSAYRLASVVDPHFSRSIFVNTKFYGKLIDFWRPEDVQTYLGTNNLTNFYITLPPGVEKLPTDRFYNNIYRAYVRDAEKLTSLQYDVEAAKHIGIHNLKKYLFELARRKCTDSTPSLLNQIKEKVAQHHAQKRKLEQKKNIDIFKLRMISSDYSSQFIKGFSLALHGSSTIESKIYGHTLEDEKTQLELIHPEWVDSFNQVISIDVDKWKIPYSNSNLFGAPQLMRLFSLFSSLVQNLDKEDTMTHEEIIAELGILRPLHGLEFYKKAAFRLAHANAERLLFPLVSQLSQRATQILKRLGTIIQSQLKRQNPSDADSDIDLTLYSGYLRAGYEGIVDELGELCLREVSECLDQVLLFDLSKYTTKIPKEASTESQLSVVTTLMNQMFTDISQQFVREVTVKCYDVLISRGQSVISSYLQEISSNLNDASISKLFDITSLEATIVKEEKEINKGLELLEIASEAISENAKILDGGIRVVAGLTATASPNRSMSRLHTPKTTPISSSKHSPRKYN